MCSPPRVSTHVQPPVARATNFELRSQNPAKRNLLTMKMITKYAAGLLAALLLPAVAQAQFVGPTNFVAYNFNVDQVTGRWGNWFGNDFVGVLWDSTVDASNNPSSGSLQL